MLDQMINFTVLAFFSWGGPELFIVAGIFVLLFGGAKLPGLMRNLGRSVNEFKAGIKEPVDSTRLGEESDEAST